MANEFEQQLTWSLEASIWSFCHMQEKATAAVLLSTLHKQAIPDVMERCSAVLEF